MNTKSSANTYFHSNDEQYDGLQNTFTLPTPPQCVLLLPVFKLHHGWFLLFKLKLNTIIVFQILSICLDKLKHLLFLCIMNLITGFIFFPYIHPFQVYFMRIYA